MTLFSPNYEDCRVMAEALEAWVELADTAGDRDRAGRIARIMRQWGTTKSDTLVS